MCLQIKEVILARKLFDVDKIWVDLGDDIDRFVYTHMGADESTVRH